MLPVGNPASWMTKHDKDACFALNSCGQIAKKCVALRSCDENHFFVCSLKFLGDCRHSLKKMNALFLRGLKKFVY